MKNKICGYGYAWLFYLLIIILLILFYFFIALRSIWLSIFLIFRWEKRSDEAERPNIQINDTLLSFYFLINCVL